MKMGNWIAAILLFLLAAAVWTGASAFPPESAFFPRVVAVIIVILTGIMLLENYHIADEVVFNWKEADYGRTAKMFVVTSLYAFLLNYFGFIILTPICLMAMMLIMEKGNYLPKLLTSILTTASIYLVFEVFLDVPLPVWSF